MPSRPNILLIITDQQRGDCLSSDGHPVLLTPNMDEIGGMGARFTRAYTTCPSCIASRRSILSGQFPATHGMVGYQDGVEWLAPPTLPAVLRDAGYQTRMVGRSMHQYPPRKRYGYEEMATYDHMGADDYGDWLRQHGIDTPDAWLGAGVMHNDWTAHPWYLEERFHFTNWAVDEALRVLARRDPSCPFFLTLSFIAPHPPLQPPAFYFERYLRTGVPDRLIGDWASPPPNHGLGDGVSHSSVDLTGEALLSARAAYFGLINHVDDQLRRLLNPVTGLNGMLDDTIVLFTSDHGEMLGDHYLFRKIVPYEPSTRIPLLLRAPARFGIRPRTVLEQPVCLEDIMPTLLDLADVPIPETVEGRSLLPLLRAETTCWREYLHLEHAPLHHTLTDGREKFIWFVADGREQFFDLTRDPGECRDLIRDPSRQARINHWRAQLIAELADRPEGFSDNTRLIPGRPYPPVLRRED